MKTANLIQTDHNRQDGATNYWFDVDGESFALSGCNGELKLLDCDGCPIDECNDHDNIKQLLIDTYPSEFTQVKTSPSGLQSNNKEEHHGTRRVTRTQKRTSARRISQVYRA